MKIGPVTNAAARRRGQLPVAKGDLAALDGVTSDTLLVFCWSDVRPLRGAVGWLDWRLCGALSWAIEQRAFAAAADEVMLMPAVGRLGKRRVFAFGMGPSASACDADLERVCERARDVLDRARVARAICVAPRCALSDDPFEGAFVAALSRVFAGRTEMIETVFVEDVPAGC